MIQIIGPTSNTAYSARSIQPITEIEPMNMRYLMFSTAAAACILCAATPALAQTPYAGEQTREIKALSAEEIENYRNGEGMGLAKAAELNSYPGPKHVIQLADELHLKPAQLERIEQLYADMKQDAVELGEQIIERERALDAIFAHQKADARSVQNIVRIIGALQADLRFVHLNAHVETRAVLTSEQVAHYDELRGYGEGSDSGGHDHSKMNH